MLLNKKVKQLDEKELSHLMAVREAWRLAKCGIKVCMVSVYECGWDTLLGNYHDTVIKYVDQGLIYHRVENSVNPELQIQTEDLEGRFIEMGMI